MDDEKTLARAAYMRAWREKNREKVRDAGRIRQRIWRAKNLDKAARYHRESYARHKEKRQAWEREWRIKRGDELRRQAWERNKKRKANDPAYATRCRQHARYHRVLYRCPHFRQGIAAHFADATRSIYDNCPPGLQVDHIHPIKGKNACGLHVPWNLQYLTSSANKRKGKRIEE